jgi:hypothetical protein
MRRLINRVIQWALRENDSPRPTLGLESVRSEVTPSFRIGVMKAMNGRILEVSTYKPNNHGPDWTSEMFIVPEDQTLTQALTTLLILKGLNT